jgi:hypothetical protein
MESRSDNPVAQRACLVLTVNDHVPQALLETAISRALQVHERLQVVIPAVLPPTLPISALPPRLAARLDVLRDAAQSVADRLGAPARIDVVQCRDVADALRGTVARCAFDEIILVGPAGWTLRRAAHGETPVTVLSERQSGRHAPSKTGRKRGNPTGRFRVLTDTADASSRGASANPSIQKEGSRCWTSTRSC